MVKQVHPYNFVVGDIMRKAYIIGKIYTATHHLVHYFSFAFIMTLILLSVFMCTFEMMLTFCSNSYIDVVSVTLSISISYNSYYVSVHKSYYKCLKSVNTH